MNENTHSAILVFNDSAVAFVDGIPDTCEHKEHDTIYQTASGKLIYWHTFRRWASMVEKDRSQLIHDHQNAISDPIIMGTTQCRKCKKIFWPSLYQY